MKHIKLPNWYEGFAPGLPSANNALESTNATLKKNVTEHERLPLGQFISIISKYISTEWSKRRNPNHPNNIPFKLSIDIEKKIWYDVKECIIRKYPTRKIKSTYYIASYYYMNKNINPTDAQIDTDVRLYQSLKNMNCSSFDSLVNIIKSFHKIDFVESNYLESQCSCLLFKKNYICKHILKIGVDKQIFTLPNFTNDHKLGQKIPKGRKRKVGHCLTNL
jgi:hypothetical protein